jgi:type IV pilus assembly protein PilM
MFDFGKKTSLGIDIGSSSIKIVEVKKVGGKPLLSNYAWISIENVLDGNEVFSASSGTFLSNSLKRLLKEGKFKSRDANVSIPAFGGLITLVEFPEIAAEDLEQAIRFEAHKYIPTSLEDVIFSWDVVSRESKTPILSVKTNIEDENKQEKKEPGKMQVLLVAAPKKKVAKYEQIAKDANLDLNSIEIESFSLVRSLIGNDQGNFIILDIGLRVCNIILVEKGIIKVNRNIDSGGKDITKVIARSMNIDEKKAERMKVAGTNFFNREMSLVFPSLTTITGEVSRVAETYYGKGNLSKVDAMILSGGTAELTGLDEYFSKALNAKIIMGDPFSRLSYDPKMVPVIKKIRTHFSAAIGLALRGIDD